MTIVGGLVLVVFAITDSAHSSWASPLILTTFLIGIALLGIAVYVEGWVVEEPRLPFDLFQHRYLRPLILGLLFMYGTLGIYLLYVTLYSMNVLNTSPMQLVAWYVPHGTIEILLAIFGGMVLHTLSPRILMFVTGVAIMIESLLFALAPVDASYWRWIFIPMILSTVAVDFIFNVFNIYFSTQLPARQQGLAGSLSNATMQLGIALMLGFAAIITTGTAHQGLRKSYQNVFWFNLACGATALAIFMAFVRTIVPRVISLRMRRRNSRGRLLTTDSSFRGFA